MPRIPLWAGTAVAGAAVGAAAAVLAMSGSHAPAASQAKLSIDHRLRLAAEAAIAEERAREMALKRAAEARLEGARIVARGHHDYDEAATIAEQYLGVPYVWGGASPSGLDSSGLVTYVYEQLGVSLPHYTVSQWNYPIARHVSRRHLEPGDLVFFDGVGHVGIYVGRGKFVDAPHTGTVVRIEKLSAYLRSHSLDGALRILGPGYSA